MSPEQEALLSLSLDTVQAPTHHARAEHNSLDLHRDRQRYLADPNSLWEVSVAGTVVSGRKEEGNFDKALKLYDKCIVQHEAQVVVTHILKGVRSVYLRSPTVKIKSNPLNPAGPQWEDET